MDRQTRHCEKPRAEEDGTQRVKLGNTPVEILEALRRLANDAYGKPSHTVQVLRVVRDLLVDLVAALRGKIGKSDQSDG